jgi:hypothetical protein
VNETKAWLAAFRKTGQEPPLRETPDDAVDPGSAPGQAVAPEQSGASESCSTQPVKQPQDTRHFHQRPSGQ